MDLPSKVQGWRLWTEGGAFTRNERGKGDHKHIGDKEQVYVFQSVDQLLEDFWNDVKRCEDD